MNVSLVLKEQQQTHIHAARAGRTGIEVVDPDPAWPRRYEGLAGWAPHHTDTPSFLSGY